MPDTDDDPDLTPMIDVVFLLIVFFMTVASVITSEVVQIELPIADQSVVPDERKDRFVATISYDGTLHNGKTQIELSELKELVARQVAGNPNAPILLRVDAMAPFEFTRDVMAVCAEAGAFNLIFSNTQDD
ncbi:MAG: biopolymer transport protein ExbD [Lentimonas sp.]|jgi:biopolymer transport protein ExbD